MAVFHLVSHPVCKKKKKKNVLQSCVNMDTSADILCPAVCVSDSTNNAGMRGKVSNTSPANLCLLSTG